MKFWVSWFVEGLLELEHNWSQCGKVNKIKTVKVHHHGDKGNIMKSSCRTDIFISFSLESRENIPEKASITVFQLQWRTK